MRTFGTAGSAPQAFAKQAWALVRLAALYALDMTVVVALFIVYFLGRGLAHDRVPLSTQNARHIINLERSLGFFWEPAWQEAALRHDWMIDLANFAYLNLHLPLLTVVGFAFFFCADARKHRIIRNTILISAFLALPIYAAFPVTPPRLLAESGLDLGFADTLAGVRPDKPGAISNWYAAVPSYHFGWVALAAAGAWWCWSGWLPRIGGVLYAALMWWAIVVTANHYFLDMVAGVAMVALSAFLAVRWEDYATRQASPVYRFTVSFAGRRLPF
ncbi:MAG: hypothetical protein C0506_05985 [Anaerolinea sp.]|nr:hypothetical protein [Anaerolinea sp.]